MQNPKWDKESERKRLIAFDRDFKNLLEKHGFSDLLIGDVSKTDKFRYIVRGWGVGRHPISKSQVLVAGFMSEDKIDPSLNTITEPL
jgi:hypothetical protein